MPQSVATMEVTHRMVRMIHAMLLVVVVLQTVVVEAVYGASSAPLNPTFVDAITTVALLCAVSSVIVYIRILRPALRALRVDPDNALSNKKYRAGSIISWALALSVTIFGAKLRALGASTVQVAPFYLGGFALLLALWPRRP